MILKQMFVKKNRTYQLLSLQSVLCKCPKILYIENSDKMAYANSAGPDQTA